MKTNHFNYIMKNNKQEQELNKIHNQALESKLVTEEQFLFDSLNSMN